MIQLKYCPLFNILIFQSLAIQFFEDLRSKLELTRPKKTEVSIPKIFIFILTRI